MTVTSHIDPADLRLFLGGILSAQETERIELHLRDCPPCRVLLEELRSEGETSSDPSPGPLQGTVAGCPEMLSREVGSFASPSSRQGEPAAGSRVEVSFSFLAPPLQPGDLGMLASYRVRRLIGAGGMGMVFEAEDPSLVRRVALKVMKPELAADLKARERFLQEARAAASVANDHIVMIFQVGQDNDVPFLAMQYLEGESLEDRLRREGKLPLADVLRIGREVAEGLAAAHDRGLIHRDIKPSNIWLESDGNRGSFKRVRILDFGLARPRASERQLTSTGIIVGTPGYLAPEQARGLPLDYRCDLFSLGCVLYCMLTGEQAFRGTDILAVLSALATEDPRPISEIDPTVPAALIALIDELLAKSPENRPASAREVADRLLEIAAEQGLTICPPGSGERRPPSSIRRPVLAPGSKSPGGRPAGPRRRTIILVAAVLAVAIAIGAFWLGRRGSSPVGTGPGREPIKVGVLHSLSGTMYESEQAVQEATLLAISEVNQQGGVLGRIIQAVVADGQSSEEQFARQAERLILQDKVCALFGCWTSASRKAVRPIVEKHHHLLFYPVQYEGLEQSPSIVYLGSTPNQQIVPALTYAIKGLGKRRLFLVGSDYVFPHAANAIIRDQVKTEAGVEIVGEEYIRLGSSLVGEVIQKIVKAKPDLILNTINGSTNQAFFNELRAAGIRADQVPTISFSIAENELRSFTIQDVVDDYAAWSYFMSIDRPENRTFIKKFQARYGPQRVLSDPMEAGYVAVHLWAEAARSAQTTDPEAIRQALKGKDYAAPHGTLRIDPETLHAWKPWRLGKILPSGQFEIVLSKESPIRPEPFPASRSQTEWQQFLDQLYQGWGNRWEAPQR